MCTALSCTMFSCRPSPFPDLVPDRLLRILQREDSKRSRKLCWRTAALRDSCVALRLCFRPDRPQRPGEAAAGTHRQLPEKEGLQAAEPGRPLTGMEPGTFATGDWSGRASRGRAG